MKTTVAALLLALSAFGCQSRRSETSITGSRQEGVFSYENGRTVESNTGSVGLSTTVK